MDGPSFESMIFFDCFDHENDYEKNKAEKNYRIKHYKNVKFDESKADYAKIEAAKSRKQVEEQYMHKNLSKLSNLLDLKKNLKSIEELPYKKPVIRGGQSTLESGFKFTFEDSSSFEVVNKIVVKYSSISRKYFQQYPTTFHDVTFPDGTKMKSPSEEKMVKEFAK